MMKDLLHLIGFTFVFVCRQRQKTHVAALCVWSTDDLHPTEEVSISIAANHSDFGGIFRFLGNIPSFRLEWPYSAEIRNLQIV